MQEYWGYKCAKCPRWQNLVLYSNLFSSPQVKRYACDLCSHTSATRSKLRTHRLTHTRKRGSICNKCGKITSGNLKLHRCNYTYKGYNEGIFRCTLCNETLIGRHNLRKHRETKHPEQCIKCDLCPANFLSRKNMMRHRALHTRIQKHKEYIHRCVVYYFFTRTASQLDATISAPQIIMDV